MHHGLPKIRGRRSIPSVLLLKKDPSVSVQIINSNISIIISINVQDILLYICMES